MAKLSLYLVGMGFATFLMGQVIIAAALTGLGMAVAVVAFVMMLFST